MCPPPCGPRRNSCYHTPRQYSESYIQKYDVCLIASMGISPANCGRTTPR